MYIQFCSFENPFLHEKLSKFFILNELEAKVSFSLAADSVFFCFVCF